MFKIGYVLDADPRDHMYTTIFSCSTDSVPQPMQIPVRINAGTPEVLHCQFCGSEWTKDSRGNCGSCGAPAITNKKL